MGAEQFTCLCVKHGLNQAFRLSKSDRLSITDERKAADTDLITGLLAFASVMPTEATCGMQ